MKNLAVYTPHHDGSPNLHPCSSEDSGIFLSEDSYLPDRRNIFRTFPGPLMNSKMQIEDLLGFIERKAQECLQHLDKPDQKETYCFWKIMELLCCKNGKVPLADVGVLLFRSYKLLKKKLWGVKSHGWCLSLARLLCSAAPDDEHLNAVTEMVVKLDSEGLTYAAHICYVVAQEKLESCQGFSFELIGCDSLPGSQSALREAIERTEVYEYVRFLSSGLARSNFQIYKYYHAFKLAEFGLSDQAFEYCETIARAIATFPRDITQTTMELTIALCERLLHAKGREPEWLANLRQLHTDKLFKLAELECGLMTSEMFARHLPRPESHITPREVFESRYIPGEPLGEGAFGSISAGVCRADGKQIAMKYVCKSRSDMFITIPGETQRLPLEVALMHMVCKPSHCHHVLELFEWFETSHCYILILERPTPCTDLRQFLKGHKGRLSEPLARHVMRQVVQAARHCCDCGVLHRDIKAENLLINTDTLEVKLIDFGCGDLLKDTPYTTYTGTRAFYPPEWVCEGEYHARPATTWGLGVLLFDLVCGNLPFTTKDDIVNRNIHFAPGVSRGCRSLILWCLARHPRARPTFEEILCHAWFTEPQNKNTDSRETLTFQFHLLESHITAWEEFESLYSNGEPLSKGSFGTLCAGVRIADGKQVAIKHAGKSPNDRFITIPGETQRLPLEVALMQMVSKPVPCENVVELIEWFEMPDCYIFILERPGPCTDLRQFLKGHKGRLSEPLARHVMCQVVQATRHCWECGVLYRDIKAENLLINTDTLEVKLIDFRCCDFLKDTPYTTYSGKEGFLLPEWVCEGEYHGRPATVWSLGVLLFDLVCGDLPFHNEDDMVHLNTCFAPGVSEVCHDLILWCLLRWPRSRPTFEELLSHEWFMDPENKVKESC